MATEKNISTEQASKDMRAESVFVKPSKTDIILAVVFAVLALINEIVLVALYLSTMQPMVDTTSVSAGVDLLSGVGSISVTQIPNSPDAFGNGGPAQIVENSYYIRVLFITLLLLVSNAGIAVRRQYPFATFCVALATFVISTIFEPWLLMVAATLAFLLCSTCIYSDLKKSIAALVIVVCTMLLGIILRYEFLQNIFSNVSLIVIFVAIAAIGNSIASRRAYNAELEQRLHEAERATEAVAQKRVEEERVHIAREIHDITAHSLSAISVQASAAERWVDTDPKRTREAIEAIRGVSKDSLAEIRSMIAVLRSPQSSAEFAPTTDLSRLQELKDYLENANLTVATHLPLEISQIPAFASVAAFHILREAATNTVRHAHANHVEITVECTSANLKLIYSDDGVGFLAEATRPEGHHGLEGMSERISALGGTIQVDAAPNKGCTITCTIPIVARKVTTENLSVKAKGAPRQSGAPCPPEAYEEVSTQSQTLKGDAC